MQYGDVLKLVREAKGLNLTQASQVAKVNLSTWMRWEKLNLVDRLVFNRVISKLAKWNDLKTARLPVSYQAKRFRKQAREAKRAKARSAAIAAFRRAVDLPALAEVDIAAMSPDGVREMRLSVQRFDGFYAPRDWTERKARERGYSQQAQNAKTVPYSVEEAAKLGGVTVSVWRRYEHGAARLRSLPGHWFNQ